MLDGAPQVFGSPATAILDEAAGGGSVARRYAVVGHFDDPGAQRCHSIPFGWSPLDAPGNPEPVAACRTMFAATQVTPLDGE